ncbi:hypothetical protein BUZ61_00185 [Staphylococcus nepalensis]|uniref:Lipocalin-like domain-containing protein n=1 Tax=Staphylococcus nepalensis TaxID=214473 RepID=A0A2T4SE90_9STAP|nr:hypothetical protein [Staphylococcus nepalensis]PTK60986.1 hypothetical protein BUZ61_00185 [Staphylococcus nepalensis]
MNYKKHLPGKWKIVATSFSMWKSDKNKNPTITYSLHKDVPLIFNDLVEYKKNHKLKSITGYDKLRNESFIWRGKGWLKPFTSKWKVLYLDSDLLIIKFSATLITPSGMDILVRNTKDFSYYKERINGHPKLFNLNTVETQNLHWFY